MRLKRQIFLLSGILAVLLLWLLWNNALLLDDFHRAEWKVSYKEAMNTEGTVEDGLQGEGLAIGEKKGRDICHIHINLDILTLYLFKGNELVKTYPVSGGGPGTPSPIGTWRIINKDTWGEGFGGAWLGFNVPWGLYGIHGTTEPWFIGRSNSSKGCIRMKNADIKELYRLVPYGATVTIVFEDIPFRLMRSGDVGSDVLAAEEALKGLGYYNGSLDGVFGDTLLDSVKRFQKDNSLYTTGIINISTYNLIMDFHKELSEIYLHTQSD